MRQGRFRVESIAVLEERSAPADWDKLAAKIVERAKAEARSVVEEAEARAGAISRQAQSDGYEQGLQRGFEEGRNAARTAWEAMHQQISPVVENLRALSAWAELVRSEQVLAASAAMAQKLFPTLLDREPEVLRGFLASLLNGLEGPQIQLFMDPVHAAKVEAVRERVLPELTNLQLAVDASLKAMEFRAESAQGGRIGGAVTSVLALLDEVMPNARRGH